ncbi:hypothetical protein A2U01_0072283, partial [Trifolium medium]|nr:hypothetical protein [Trifolium medium]
SVHSEADVLEALRQNLDLRGRTFRVCLLLPGSVLQTCRRILQRRLNTFASLGYSFAYECTYECHL